MRKPAQLGLVMAAMFVATPSHAQRLRTLSPNQMFARAVRRPMTPQLRLAIENLRQSKPELIQRGQMVAYMGAYLAPRPGRGTRVGAVSVKDQSGCLATTMLTLPRRGPTGRTSWDLTYERSREDSALITTSIRSKTLPSGNTLEVAGSNYHVLSSAGKVLKQGQIKELVEGPRLSARQELRALFGLQRSELRRLFNNQSDGIRLYDD